MAPGVAAGQVIRELLETLEARVLFSTYTVTSAADVAATAGNYVGTLRWAVQQANAAHASPADPSLIAFDPNFFGSTSRTITLTQGQLELNAGATTITGPGATLLSLSGNYSTRLLETFGSENAASVTQVSVSGLNFTGGSAEDFAHSEDGKLRGGAISNHASGGMTFTACTFSENQATASGGAIRNDTVLTLIGCTFTANVVTGESDPVDSGQRGGGAVENSFGSTLTVVGCTFSTNHVGAGVGGVISNRKGATLTVSDSTFSGNSAPEGGAVSNLFGLVLVRDSTLSGNSATFQGGGIYSDPGPTDTTGTRLDNTIVAGNSASLAGPDLYGFTNGNLGHPYYGSGNLIGKGNGQTDLLNGGDGNLVGSAAAPLDPKLGPLQNNGGLTKTMALLDGSPAINAGFNGAVPPGLTTDQRGNGYPRVVDFVDIGAFETSAVPLIVNTTADGPPAEGQLTLREAIRLANLRNAPDTKPSAITFDPSVFGATPKTITLTAGSLVLTNGATSIAGPGASLLTISGHGATRVFDVESNVTHLDLSGLRIFHGDNFDSGGGIYDLSTGTVNVTACTFSGNIVGYGGGGIWYDGGTGSALNVTACTFSGNRGEFGAGIFADSGKLIVTGCTFTGNKAGSGGGLTSGGGITEVVDSTFASNSADGDGGAVSVVDGAITISDSTIARNTAGTGGSGAGGGISSVAPVTLNNTIVALNEAPTDGPDLFTDVIEGNDNFGTYTGFNNLIGISSGEIGLVPDEDGNQVGTTSPINPQLGPLQNNGGPTLTMVLNPGSPALDAGSNAKVPAGTTADQRGGTYARFGGGKVDIGAYELQGTAPVTSFSAGDPAASGTSSSQHSMVTRLLLNFSEPVRPLKSDFILGLINGSGSGANDGSADTDISVAMGTPVNPSGDLVTWFLPIVAGTPFSAAVGTDGTATLGDGKYRLTFATPSSPDAGSAPNDDGGGGDALRNGALTQPAQSLTFYRLFGDVNGSMNVNTADFGVFRNAFGKRTGDSGFNAAFDFDGNGTVNNLDFGQFRGRLGKSFT